MSGVWVRVWMKLSTLTAARAALRILGMQMHDSARVNPDPLRKEHLRTEGDHYLKEERNLQDSEMHEGEDYPHGD